MPTFLHSKRRAPTRALLAILVLLLGSAGCKSVPSDGPRLAPEPTPPGRWSEATLANGWITVSLGLPHVGEPPYPIVLSPILPDHELLARGIGVARWKTNWGALGGLAAPAEATPAPTPSPAAQKTPPAKPVGAWLLRSTRPGNVGRAYFHIITTEAHNTLPVVVDHLIEHPDVDPRRLAITGSSTGGFTALQAMAEDPRIAVGVVQVACGAYRAFLKSSSLALDDQERWLQDGEMILDDAYAAEIDRIAPNARADHFPPRPLLLISGAQDRAIPAACVASTAARFARAYDDAGFPKRFEWVEFPDRGHNMGPEAPPLILDFLQRWLETDQRLLRGP